MTPVVVDASVAAKWLVRERLTDEALRLRGPEYVLYCPDLLYPEVGNVLWKKVRAGEIEEADGRELVSILQEAPLRVEPSVALLPAAWEIAVGHDRSVYDGVYLALAAALDASLVTADRRFHRAFEGTGLGERFLRLEDLPD